MTDGGYRSPINLRGLMTSSLARVVDPPQFGQRRLRPSPRRHHINPKETPNSTTARRIGAAAAGDNFSESCHLATGINGSGVLLTVSSFRDDDLGKEERDLQTLFINYTWC